MNAVRVNCPVRQGIDNRLNRDLIAQARQQGFVFSNPFADADTWQRLETANFEDPARPADPETADWLFGKAMEATLFFHYLQTRQIGRIVLDNTGEPFTIQPPVRP